MTIQAVNAWRCVVCGYVHRGPEPPDSCPVCGAASTDFEAFAEETPRPVKATVNRWQCLNCSYVHADTEPPAVCPICAAPKDRFVPVGEEGAAVSMSDAVTNVVVIGGGVAGVSAVESLRTNLPHARITLISRETDLPYYRLNLTRFLAGEIGDEALSLHPASWYDEKQIELLRGAEVEAISLEGRTLELRDGTARPFEKLIVTVGAHPFIPPFPGMNREGVASLRTTRDANRILEMARAGGPCVCIGGGLLGIETAGALARQGVDVTLLESHGWLMPRQLNRRAGDLLERHIANLGITLRKNARTEELVGDERVAGVRLEDGSTVAAGCVIVATGIRPNSYLARRAGLEVNKGIVVNNYLASSHPDVLAAGDVAEHRGMLYGSWSASQYQGSLAGMNAAGLSKEFGGIPRSNTLKVLGLDLLSIGQIEPEDGSYQLIEGEADDKYRRFVFRDGNLVGAVLLGDTSITGAVKKAIEGRSDFSGLLTKRPDATDVVGHLAAASG